MGDAAALSKWADGVNSHGVSQQQPPSCYRCRLTSNHALSRTAQVKLSADPCCVSAAMTSKDALTVASRWASSRIWFEAS